MLILIFAAELSSRRELVLAGALTMLVGLTGWHWPHHVPTTEAELAFEHEHGIAVWPNGSPRVNRWAMGLLILLLAIALGVFLFSYFYLRLATPAWPPDNIAPPPLLLPAVSTLLVLAAAATMRWAHAAVRRGSEGGLRGALAGAFVAGAFVAGALALGLLVYDYSLLPFDHTLNAYGSIFYLLGGFLMLMVGLGLA